jgi:methionyl-tRNA synthetase
VDGTKMSKSRGTFINARTYLDHLDPEYLRYYFAARLGPTVDDMDLNLEDFVQRVNAELVGKVVNIASRCAAFINREFGNRLGGACPDDVLWARAVAAGAQVARHYEDGDYARAMREIMQVADEANTYIAAQAPWARIKQEGTRDEVQAVCTLGLNLFRAVAIYLKPVLPKLAASAEAFFAEGPWQWDSAQRYLVDHEVAAFRPLMTRIEAAKVQKMIEAGRVPEAPAKATQPAAGASAAASPAGTADTAAIAPVKPEITIDDHRGRTRRGCRQAAAAHARPRRRQPQHLRGHPQRVCA